MALRNQPYLPLYVQDYLTDEKLNMCSPATQGIYIKIMCVMHKSKEYGVILLKQKDKQKSSTCLNFAYKFAKILPFTIDDIEAAINELLDEDVLQLDGDKLIQKRMVRDNKISIIRSKAGSKGGKKTQSFAKAKSKANSEYEYEYEDINIIVDYFNNKTGKNFKSSSRVTSDKIKARLNEKYTIEDFKKVIDNKVLEWQGTDMDKYLRPETLFSPKFESYLNQKPKIDPTRIVQGV